MDQLLDALGDVWTTMLDYAREGFGEVNAVLGIVIAIVAAFLMTQYRALLMMAAGATLFHIVVERVVPTLSDGGAARLPPVMEGDFWHQAIVLYVGYLVMIFIFFTVRKTLLKGAHGH